MVVFMYEKVIFSLDVGAVKFLYCGCLQKLIKLGCIYNDHLIVWLSLAFLRESWVFQWFANFPELYPDLTFFDFLKFSCFMEADIKS